MVGKMVGKMIGKMVGKMVGEMVIPWATEIRTRPYAHMLICALMPLCIITYIHTYIWDMLIGWYSDPSQTWGRMLLTIL